MTQCAAAPCREPRVLRRLGAFAEVAPPLRAPLGVVSRKPSCRDTVQPALGAVSPQRGEALYSAQEGTKTSADRDEKRVCVKARAAHVGHLWICRRHIWGEFTGKLHRFSAGLRLSSAASAESHKRVRSPYKRAGGLASYAATMPSADGATARFAIHNGGETPADSVVPCPARRVSRTRSSEGTWEIRRAIVRARSALISMRLEEAWRATAELKRLLSQRGDPHFAR